MNEFRPRWDEKLAHSKHLFVYSCKNSLSATMPEQLPYHLITRNRRPMPQHLREHLARDRHIPGIFMLRPGAPLRQIIEDLLLIWEAAYPDEYEDQIVHIPL